MLRSSCDADGRGGCSARHAAPGSDPDSGVAADIRSPGPAFPFALSPSRTSPWLFGVPLSVHASSASHPVSHRRRLSLPRLPHGAPRLGTASAQPTLSPELVLFPQPDLKRCPLASSSARYHTVTTRLSDTPLSQPAACQHDTAAAAAPEPLLLLSTQPTAHEDQADCRSGQSDVHDARAAQSLSDAAAQLRSRKSATSPSGGGGSGSSSSTSSAGSSTPGSTASLTRSISTLRPAAAHRPSVRTWSSKMFNGGFTFSICPHGVEHHMHAELPSCCRMEQERQQQILKAGDKTNSRDAAAVAAACVTSGDESATSDHDDALSSSKSTSPLAKPFSRLNPGAFHFKPVTADLDNTIGTNGRVQRLCASPCSSAITSVQSTPDDYLGLGLHVHPLTDPYLMSNLASSWWASVHFWVIRMPCYMVAILCGMFWGLQAIVMSFVRYFQKRPHDAWDMLDEEMATMLLHDYQNLLTRLDATPHIHPTCSCGEPADQCAYFVFDARAIAIYIPFRGLHVAPSITTLIAHTNGRCSIFSISINGEVMFEASNGLDSWKLAKLYVRQAQLYILVSGSHPLTHFSSEAFQVVTDCFFGPQDLVAQLVAPHAEWNREINSYALLAEGSVLNPKEGAPWIFSVHTCARVYFGKMMRACFNERVRAGLSTMHAFPSAERFFTQPLPRVSIDIAGKNAPKCWADGNEFADRHTRSSSLSSEASHRASPSPSPSPSPLSASGPASASGLHNWLSVNPSFYPYYLATFEFVSSVLNSHQGQVQIGDRMDDYKQYLQALRHYLRADYSIVHKIDPDTAAIAGANPNAAALTTLTQTLAVVLTEYVFNVSFVHSGQHQLLGKAEPAQFPMRIRIPWSPSASLSYFDQPLLPRSVYTCMDLFRSHVYFSAFVHWWNNKLYANHEIIRTRYTFERSGGELAQAVRTFKISLRAAEQEHLAIAKERKLTPVPLHRICRTIEW